MELSQKAKEELREILRKDIGERGLALFSEDDLNDFGARLLGIMAVIIKYKVSLAKSS